MPKILICEFFLFIGKHFWLWKGEQIVGPTNVQNKNIFFTQIGLEFAAFSRFLHLERLVKIVPTSEIQDFHLPLPMQQPLLTQSIKQLQVKFNILRRPQNLAKSSPFIWPLQLHRTNLRWRFQKKLWSSHNIWSLTKDGILQEVISIWM